MSWNIVETFEKNIAVFYNAPYAVATDSCTHALELCLRYKNIKTASCPTNTYVSVPMTFEKLGLQWQFRQQNWSEFYMVSDDIMDAATYWQPNGYIGNAFMCISFQFRKHLGLGRGGAILCTHQKDYEILKKMSYDGRVPTMPWAEQDIDTLGYHYYMTPETAQLGLDKLPNAITTKPKIWSYTDYPDLTTMTIFKGKHVK
jgi:dTDP-4-amino-4,6-dideoxygalactose transaminase